jgi:hypothetical protein
MTRLEKRITMRHAMICKNERKTTDCDVASDPRCARDRAAEGVLRYSVATTGCLLPAVVSAVLGHRILNRPPLLGLRRRRRTHDAPDD